MESEDTSSITKSGRLVRLFVGGLPLGLVIMGALSFVIYFHKKKEKAPVVMEFAVMLRRDFNEQDFNRYVRILADDIISSTMTIEEKKAAVATFIESSMGMENMGYEVARRKRDSDGSNILYSELPGGVTSRRIVVSVSYDGLFQDAATRNAAAEQIAGMMCLAHSLTGTRPPCTIRFLASEYSGAVEFERPSRWLIRLTADASNMTDGDVSSVNVADGSKDIQSRLENLKTVVLNAAEAAAR